MRTTTTLCYFFIITIAVNLLSAAPLELTETNGGEGGRVLQVSNLESKGQGSLRWALAGKGPRIVDFKVAGVIDLKGESLYINHPNVTVRGETAPSPGITLIKGGVIVTTNDVILRHLRVRPGDAGAIKGKLWEPDGITCSGGGAHDILIENCSVSWAIDENIAVSGPRHEGPEATSHRVIVRNCIIAEALSRATHEKGEHSKGMLIHDNCRDVAVIGNLFAHNRDRNPYLKGGTSGIVVNNVIYNPGYAAIQARYFLMQYVFAFKKPHDARAGIVGNILLHGVDTETGLSLVSGNKGRADIFLHDNHAVKADGSPAEIIDFRFDKIDREKIIPAGLKILPVSRVLEHVLANAGARPRDRDATDRRIINDVRKRKGRIIDSQEDVGGYPQ